MTNRGEDCGGEILVGTHGCASLRKQIPICVVQKRLLSVGTSFVVIMLDIEKAQYLKLNNFKN